MLFPKSWRYAGFSGADNAFRATASAAVSLAAAADANVSLLLPVPVPSAAAGRGGLSAPEVEGEEG